jgi:hydroxymethylpyrimidine pyrophosphatase-like HAD family hydrolase
MGQAVDEVKQAADAVTATVNEDGAALEIDTWFGDAAPRSGEMGA